MIKTLKNRLPVLKNVWIDPQVRAHPIARAVIEKVPRNKIIFGTPPAGKPAPSRPIESIKQNLFVTRFNGHLVKPCPGTRGMICCGYWVINTMMHCPMDCHYCILQTYLSVPTLTIYVNEETVKNEIRARLLSHPGHICRFGTGELGDSLVHDAFTGFSRRMVPFFAATENGILELKTKTANIQNLIGMNPKGHTVVSWSLNPETLIKELEPMTASLSQRLEAARQCQRSGYWIGLHFDPVIWFDGWEKAYSDLFAKLSHTLDPQRIIWISMAGFRYTSGQKDMIVRRFPDSRLFLGEFFRNEDGKFRYLQHRRIQLYRKLLQWIRDWDPSLFVYYCMENQRVWRETFKNPPENTGDLDERFNRRVHEFIQKR